MIATLLRATALACLLSTFAPHATAQAQSRSEAFETAPCMFDLPPGLPPEAVECGYLTVPARHADPAGPTIRLAVAIFASQAPNRAPDPLFMMQGGPGGSTIDTYSQLLFTPQMEPLRASRDIVLFDQRGTLYSEPNLLCPEFLTLTEQTIERQLSIEESERLSLGATARCRERLVGQGIDLAAFNSLENAADVDALRIALGYEQINLYGVSYGTLLAQHVLRLAPGSLRSVILDAVVPTTINPNTMIARSIDRSLNELFSACTADTGCNEAYPDLERRFFALVERLNKVPARVPVTDPKTSITYDAAIDGESFYSIVFQLLYATDILPALPRIIAGAEQNDWAFLSTLVLPQIVFDRTLAIGMYQSTTCAEDADFTPADVDTAGVRPQVADEAVRSAKGLLASCALWQVPMLDPAVDAPVTSDVPTLLLSGRFDPVTPEPLAAEAARTLSRHYSFTFGYVGHGAATTGTCPAGIVLAFLTDPEAEPNSACIAERPAPIFVSPVTTLPTTIPARVVDLLNGKRPGDLWQPLLLVGALLTLLSALVVWPLVALIRWLAGRPAQLQPGGPLARLLAVLAAIAALVFVVGLTVVIGLGVFNNDLSIFFGVPRSAAWLFALPLLSTVLALGMLLVLFNAWQGGHWSAASRAYYTLLTLAAVGYVVVVATWGTLRAFV